MRILIICCKTDLFDVVTPSSKTSRLQLLVTSFGSCFAMLSNRGRVLFILCVDNPEILAILFLAR